MEDTDAKEITVCFAVPLKNDFRRGDPFAKENFLPSYCRSSDKVVAVSAAIFCFSANLRRV